MPDDLAAPKKLGPGFIGTDARDCNGIVFRGTCDRMAFAVIDEGRACVLRSNACIHAVYRGRHALRCWRVSTHRALQARFGRIEFGLRDIKLPATDRKS